MRINTPDILTVLYQVSEKIDKQPLLTVTMVAGFSLTSPNLVAPGDLWDVVAALGDGTIFDSSVAKPAGEFFVAGSCYPPGGEAAACPVSVRVGSLHKKVTVFGDRYWNRVDMPSKPVPFSSMPITWSRALGGHLKVDNRSGIGLVDCTGADGKVFRPLPNIEDPQRLVTGRDHHQPPTGFAPVSIDWPSRRHLVGTVNDNWLMQTWPNLPPDADPALYQLAPPGQRLGSGFFKGDEEVKISNMHPQRSRLCSQLPGQRCRCFLATEVEKSFSLIEMKVNLDTVWLFPEAEVGGVIWRAQARVNQVDLAGIDHLVTGLEPLDREPLAKEHYLRRLLEKEEEVVEEVAPVIIPEPVIEPPPAVVVPAPELKAPPMPDPKLAELEGKVTAAREKLAKQIAPLGMTVDELLNQPAPPMPDMPTDPKEIAKKIDSLKAKLEQQLKPMGLSYDELMNQPPPKPQPSTMTADELIGTLKHLGMDDKELFAQLKKGEDAKVKLAAIEKEKKAKEAAQALKPPPVPEPEPVVEEVEVEEAAPVTAEMTREEVLAHHGRGESLAGLDLSGLDLSEADLSGADFTDATLEQVNFSKSDLSGVTMQGAILSKTTLVETNLTGADLRDCAAAGVIAQGIICTETRLGGADFSDGMLAGADLQQADCVQCDFSGADLSGAKAESANMQEAKLDKTQLSDASFVAVNFTDASLNGITADRTDFSRTVFAGVWFADMQGEKASFVGANMEKSKTDGKTALPGADFTDATLSRIAWDGADLHGAVFRRTNMEHGLLSGCDLRKADLVGVGASHANFMNSDLSECDGRQANFFKASMRQTKMDKANLNGANLYGVDLYHAKMRETTLEGSNTRATLLELFARIRNK